MYPIIQHAKHSKISYVCMYVCTYSAKLQCVLTFLLSNRIKIVREQIPDNTTDACFVRTNPFVMVIVEIRIRFLDRDLTFCLCLTRLALTSSSQAAGKALSGNLCTQTRWKSPKTLITLLQAVERMDSFGTMISCTIYQAAVYIARARRSRLSHEFP